MPYTPFDRIWAMFFGTVVGMARHHPGHGKPGTLPCMSLEACAREADQMLEIYKRTFFSMVRQGEIFHREDK